MLDSIPALLNKTFPIPSRFKSALPSDIRELSGLLTNKRGNRSLSYLTRPNFLSAYLHYFLPWNLYKLCILIPALNLTFSPNDIITDFGCGPLTFTSALWITRPDLHNLPLEINCIDKSGPALEAGKKFFLALCSSYGIKNTTWKINTMRRDIDIRKSAHNGHSSLVCAINLFNEVYENISHINTEGLRQMASNAAKLMHNETKEKGAILTVEPGVPQSGRFISLLRDELIKLGRLPKAPCTHNGECFLSGIKKEKWCHFAFETKEAPKELKRLSAAANLPKERLAFSFLLTGADALYDKEKNENIRIISDAFALPDNQFGRYGCSPLGLILLTGEKGRIQNLASLEIASVPFAPDRQRDSKSGALIVRIK